MAVAIAEREEIAKKAEELAAGDLTKVIWKDVSAKLTALFEQWQALQKSGARVPKAEADAIWKRFQPSRNE